MLLGETTANLVHDAVTEPLGAVFERQASEAHQAGFRGHVRRTHGCPPCAEKETMLMIDPGACSTAAHVPHGGLHAEERCPQVMST
jgi:hypothetical protein